MVMRRPLSAGSLPGVTADSSDEAGGAVLADGGTPADGGDRWVMRLADMDGRLVRAMYGDTELFRYVYTPWDPQLESPRPYFHPLRTLGGDVVSLYRPHDHVWHKGIAWSQPNVGPANFWGGTTYRRGEGYRQHANNGRMRHDRFRRAAVVNGTVHLDEELSWVTQQGQVWFAERRRIGALAWPQERAWMLSFETAMRNVSGSPVTLGSPTTEGRDNAGYGGLFWRGPRSFSGGRVTTPDGTGGDEYMGWRGPWMAFTGQHDGHGGTSTLVFRDSPGNGVQPCQWFVRSTPFACLCPAPFFSEETVLGDGEELVLRYEVAVADGDLGVPACDRLARLMGETAVLDVPGGTP
jgi:methane monooxygenase PmoA-like